MYFCNGRHEQIALQDAFNCTVTYKDIKNYCIEFAKLDLPRSTVFILADNNIDSILAFLVSVNNKMVPLLLNANIDNDLLRKYVEIYKPRYIFTAKDNVAIAVRTEKRFELKNYELLETKYPTYILNEELAFLLSTSGTTGSPKLVRHSYKNLVESAKNVAVALNLTENERALAALPIYFTQGLNVVLSNLYVGATVLISDFSLMQKEFWQFLKDYKATSITGVPYSYEIMLRLGFLNMELPDLKIVNQGGGRLNDILFKRIAEYAVKNDKKFIATYGSTETTSRMCFLDPELAISKIGSIGRPIYPGHIYLIDNNGKIINKSDTVGEIVYSGPNVTMGYANSIGDLYLGDEKQGKHFTGDMAYYDADGCYFIVGRKGRFVKIYGYRLSLDEIEKILRDIFKDDFACVGNDKKIYIYLENKSLSSDEIIKVISEKLGLLKTVFEVNYIYKLPRNSYGKILYKELESRGIKNEAN